MHHGTLEARKILLWVSLWQQILWAAANRSWVAEVPDVPVIMPFGDITKLAQDYLPDARQPQQTTFLRRLAARRSDIVSEQWRRSPDLASWIGLAQQWQLVP